MKIVLGSHYFHPHVGGIESVVESHAKRLAERGHDVTVVASSIGANSMRARRDGYKIRRYRAWNPVENLGAPYPVPNPIDARRRLTDIFSDGSVDVLHVHGLNYLTTTVLLQYAPPTCPVVMHQHTPFVEYPFPFELVERINDCTVGRWNLRQADVVFCINSCIEQYVRTLEPRTNTRLLMNGVDTEFFHPDRAEGSNGFSCDPETPVFFTLSRMSQKKGIDVLLETIRALERNDVDVHFAVAGDGPMREQVERTARETDKMEVLGRLSDDELARRYAAADAFVFTSKSGEAFPTLTMIEAYASGTPVVASKLSDDPVGVRDHVDSVLVEPGDPAELTRAVTELAASRERLSEMGVNARETAERNFSIDERITQLESCYETLLARVD